MSGMIERVALVLAEKMNGGMFSSPKFYNGEQREVWMAHARAAIEAMADPDFEMVDAGSSAINSQGGTYYSPQGGSLQTARDCWRAMIRVASKETV